MQHDLDIYIRARYTLLWVVTSEESRALAEIDQLAKEQRKPLYVWSATTGVANPAIPTRVDGGKRDPLALLTAIMEDREPGLWVLRDFHPFLRDHTVVRRLREAAFSLESSNKPSSYSARSSRYRRSWRKKSRSWISASP